MKNNPDDSIIELPLRGVRVVDFTHMLAGPYCTWVLAMLGADVVKVERPGGDFARGIAPFGELGSHYFNSVNRGKRSITLDLKDEQDRDVARHLAACSDALVENNRPGVMNRLGLGFDDVSRLNPAIIYASLTGFGSTGAYRDRPAFDTIIQGMSGLMSLTGEADGPPTRVGASISDIGAGMYCAIGILSALASRGEPRQAVYLDVAMLDCQLAILENAIGRALNTGKAPRRIGNRHPLIVPFQPFPTKDGMIVVCCDTEAQWTRFCEAIDQPQLAKDVRFDTLAGRCDNHAALEPIIEATLIARPASVWLDILHAADVPAGPINGIDEILADGHVKERGMIVGDPGERYVNFPLFQGARPHSHAPRIDEHRAEILSELARTMASRSLQDNE